MSADIPMEPYNPEAPAIRPHWGSPQRGGHSRGGHHQGGYHSAPPRQRDLVSVPTEPEPSKTGKEGECVIVESVTTAFNLLKMAPVRVRGFVNIKQSMIIKNLTWVVWSRVHLNSHTQIRNTFLEVFPG